MSQDKPGQFDFTTPVVLNFEHIFTPHTFKGDSPDKARYEADLEIDGDSPDLRALKVEALAVAAAKWPGRDFAGENKKVDANGNTKMQTFTFPWELGDVHADKAKAKGKDREQSRGKLVLKARSKYAPKLAVIQNGTIDEFLDERRALAKESFRNGTKVYGRVTFAAHDPVGQNPAGVHAFLDMVVATKEKAEGYKSQGGASPAEVFKSYAGRLSTEDPTRSTVTDTVDAI